MLNRPEIVAQRTRDRVNASIRQLGFVRNESARQLRAGLAVILCNGDDQERKEKRYLELLEAHRVRAC